MASHYHTYITLKFREASIDKDFFVKHFGGQIEKTFTLSCNFFYWDSQKIFAKEVTSAAREQLTHQKYKEALFQPSTLRTLNNRIVTDRHVLQTVSINKLSQSPFDDKCFIL